MTTPTDLSDQAIALGRFGHHPDPATDFEVEVECLQGRLFNAAHGIACPECQPESVREVFDAIQDAMTFRVGGNPGTVYAKQLLRALESYARELQAQQGQDGVGSVSTRMLDSTPNRASP